MAQMKAAAEAGFTNLICFSGNWDDLDDKEGQDNCATEVKRLMPLAEKDNAALCTELLNGRADPVDSMGNKSACGVAHF
jgi:hydroxypyruvate isomerase